MYWFRVTLIFFLLFGVVHPAPVLAQARENIVLLPIDVSPEYANQKELIGGAFEQSLSKKYNVFYGEMVEAALQEEYAKDDCTAESCVQNIAIQFNGEIIADASVQRVEESTFIRVKFQNVITGELEAIVQDACRQCSFAQLVSFIDERTSNIALNSSEGLTALLEKQVEPNKQPNEPLPDARREAAVTPPRNLTISQETTRQQPKSVKGPSYWKWGLGALVLAAGGGGGGGGGGGSGSGSNSAPSTPTNITPFDTPGSAWIGNTELLGGGYTFVEMPNSDHTQFYTMTYKYGGGGSLPDIKYLSSSTVTHSTGSDSHLFQFQVEDGTIKRLALVNTSLADFDVADGASIIASLSDMPHLSYFSNEDGDAFMGLALTSDFQNNVDGIARIFFGVSETEYEIDDDYDRVVRAYHGGQPAPDATVLTSGEADFSGFSAGQWVPHDDVSYWTTSDITVTVDFDNPGSGAELASSNTRISSNPTQAGSWAVQNNLNFVVEGAVLDDPKRVGASSTNAAGDILPTLSGDGQAQGGAWSAFFYEEFSAMETSGAFTFQRNNGDHGDKYIGSFGARRE